MATLEAHTLPSYERQDVPSYEDAPSYDSPQYHPPTTGMNLTFDATGTFIKTLPINDSPPLYTLSNTLLQVTSTGSIHVKRTSAKGDEVTVYAIGEHYMSPMHSRKPDLQTLTVARSHGPGILFWTGLRKIVWDFSTHVRASGNQIVNPSSFPVDPVYMIGTAPGPGTVQNHLFQFCEGKWVDEDDNVVAIEREGGAEMGGMPVLSLMKDFDEDMMDLLVSGWCVTLWGELSKRARRRSSTGDKRLSIGKFSLG